MIYLFISERIENIWEFHKSFNIFVHISETLSQIIFMIWLSFWLFIAFEVQANKIVYSEIYFKQ
jgi:hypothetical protein